MIKKYKIKTSLTVLAIFLYFSFSLFSCGDRSSSETNSEATGGSGETGGGDTGGSTTPITIDSSFYVDYLGNSGDFSYAVDLGDSPMDVYFIFTNSNLSGTVNTPEVSSSKDNSTDSLLSMLEPDTDEKFAESGNGFSIIDNANIAEYNRLLPGEVAENIVQNKSLEITPPLFDTEGESVNFYDATTSGTYVAATCRKVVPDILTTYGSKTLNVYVADDCWSDTGSEKTYYVTQDMIDTLANKFLTTGLNNDIYDWVTNIYGNEWGSSPYSYLISDTGEITILLYDIYDDDMVGQSGSFVTGYFWSRDNYKNTVVATSNQRIMFCLDAVLFANNSDDGEDTNDGTGWAATDYWPEKLISTLAHEFQHMIHYYQKNVLKNTSSETWLNEMCSLVTEDMIADKLQNKGPRNVTYNDPSAGSAGNTGGRLPLYNYYNDATVNTWYSSDVLISYSINYAFGAYLARNFGGALFLKNVVQCAYGSTDAIEYALSQVDGNTDTAFTNVLKKWAVANILSDITNTNTLYTHVKYNNGSSWITDNSGYNMGSINLYNYCYYYNSYAGPWIYNSISIMPSSLAQSSNTYYRAAKGATGEQTFNLSTDPNVITTVVIKAVE